jgi:hypothetical protein
MIGYAVDVAATTARQRVPDLIAERLADPRLVASLAGTAAASDDGEVAAAIEAAS